MDRKIYRSIILAIFIAAGAAMCFVLPGCNVVNSPLLPPVTANNAFTAPPTDEPPVMSTSAPTATPAADIPVTFVDINFENAVRDFIGRGIGPIYPSDLSEIVSFSARVSGIVNIREIAYFTSLEELDLMGNRIADFSPIMSLKKLKKLNIAKNFTVMMGDRDKGLDISPVGALPVLEELDASNNLITDISALNSVKTLKYLDIRTNRLSDLSALEGCISLEYLNISGSFRIDSDGNEAGISDISALSALSELKTLYMSNGLVGSLEPVSKLKKLEYIDATYNALRAFPDMKEMESLKTLIVRANNIYALTGAERAPGLVTLDVRDNFIREIGEILRMRSLETIYLDGNPILDYSPMDVFDFLRKMRG